MSQLSTAINDIINVWLGLTPLSRADRPYHLLDNLELTDAPAVADRGFMFDLPVREGPTGEFGDSVVSVQWRINVFYYLSKTGRGYRELIEAVAEETNHLLLALEGTTNWTGNVLEVITDTTSIEAEDDDLVQVLIPLQVITGEEL